MKQTSRRNFLSSMAILSAGAAFGSVPGYLQPKQSKTGPAELWKLFCNNYEGIQAGEAIHSIIVPAVGKGQWVKPGAVVCFKEAGIIAIPYFIYWGKRKKASDLVIGFYKDEPGNKKITNINQYELAAICDAQNVTGKKPAIHTFTYEVSANAGNKKFLVKTRIKKNAAELVASYNQQPISILKNYNFNI